jgi:hypothetical protein
MPEQSASLWPSEYTVSLRAPFSVVDEKCDGLEKAMARTFYVAACERECAKFAGKMRG